MTSEAAILAFAILSSSFFGSWHCGAMCGPMVSLMKTRGVLKFYHAGRFIAYVTLGIFAGAAGSFFLDSSFALIRTAAAVILGVTIALLGLKLLVPQWKYPSLNPWLHTWFFKAGHSKLKRVPYSGLAMGLLSALLPCGWLYTYVIAAAATKSPLAGGVTLALFWLGGLPALTAIPSLLKAGIAAAGLKQQRIAGAILIASSLYSIAIFFWV